MNFPPFPRVGKEPGRGAGQFASPYVGMGNNPVIGVDPDGRWALGGRSKEIMMYREAQKVVARWLKELMESFSEEEARKEFERLEMLDYADRHGIGQGEGDSDLDSDRREGEDPPGSQNNQTHEYHQWQQLTPSEKDIIKHNPNILIDLYNNRQLAEKLTAEYFPNARAWNDYADAFRHAIFNALNTICFGDNLAMQLGYAHEFFPDNPSLEFRMDIYNNAIGRYYGNIYSFLSSADLGRILYNATMNGELRMIENGVRLIPTKVQ